MNAEFSEKTVRLHRSALEYGTLLQKSRDNRSRRFILGRDRETEEMRNSRPKPGTPLALLGEL